MGPLRGRPAWDEVAKPSQMTEGMQPDTTTGSGFAGSASMSSVETPDRAEQAGGMKSAQTVHNIGRGGVGKSRLEEPPADPNAHMLKDGGKY